MPVKKSLEKQLLAFGCFFDNNNGLWFYCDGRWQVVPINETIRLEITSTNGDNPDDVNLTLLEEKFTVVKETSQNSISIFNGRTDSIKESLLLLL